MILTPEQSAVAACLLDAMTDKEIIRATGLGERLVKETNVRLRRKFQARNRVDLALKLQAMVFDAAAKKVWR